MFLARLQCYRNGWDNLRLSRRNGSKMTSMLFPNRLPTNSELKSPSQKHEERDRVDRCISFLDRSPDPFHCVKTVAEGLDKAGFKPLSESKPWQDGHAIKRGGKASYFNKNTFLYSLESHILC